MEAMVAQHQSPTTPRGTIDSRNTSNSRGDGHIDFHFDYFRDKKTHKIATCVFNYQDPRKELLDHFIHRDSLGVDMSILLSIRDTLETLSQ